MYKIFFFLSVLTAHLSLWAEPIGEKLERQLWADIEVDKWDAIEKRIATDFQSIHSDGARNRQQEIGLIKDLYAGKYAISNMKVTGDDTIQIVTYTIAVEETIDQKRLPPAPMPRLSVWKNNKGKWQWVAHANLNPITQQ